MPRATIVGIHGQPGSAADWAPVFGHLPDDIVAVALDRPGYGRNSLPASGIEENARWLVHELERVNARGIVLVGHSYGGGIAITAAAHAPDRVVGLVLVASIGPTSLEWWDTLLAAPVLGPAIAFTGLAVLPRVVRNRNVTPGPWRTFLVEQRELVHGLDRVNALLPHIAVPTHILADPADPVVPITSSYALHDAIPDSRMDYLHGGGHNLPTTKPAAIVAAVDAVIERAG